MTRAAIIIVGGGARRLSGVAKPWLMIDGVTIIDRIVDSVRPHVDQCVLVGKCPPAWSRPDVQWTSEEPPGSGPVAAVAAGLQQLNPDVDEVLVLAGDTPFIAGPLDALLADPMPDDGVVVESDAHIQYLCSRLRVSALADALKTAGTSMRSVFEGLRVTTVQAMLTDADTWDDVAQLRQETHMDDWLTAVADKLGIDPAIDIDALLELTRDVAHNTERKNAPLTSYLLGYAAAAQELTAAQIAALAAEIGQMAKDRA